MSRRPPSVRLREWPSVQTQIASGERLIEHGWFPASSPYQFDRAKEANQRVWDEMDRRSAGLRFELPPAMRPEEIPDGGVRYYSNPLTRLIDLHNDFSELTTGVTWRSPWPRADAAWR
jgi:hypothetical protein